MNITGIDYREDKEFILYAKVNPFKKEIEILDKKPKNSQTVISIPAYLSTFRVYTFPIKDREKIKNLIKAQLQYDIPVDFESIDYAYYTHNDGRIFCVITKKSVIQHIGSKYQNINILDSEIFSLIRILNFKGKKDGKIIHFYKDKGVFLEVKNNFPERVHTLDKKQLQDLIDDLTYLSGDIPEGLKDSTNVISLYKDPLFNISYGNILRGINPVGVDFLHKDKLNITSIFIKLLLSIILIITFISAGLYVNNLYIKKQIEYIKRKEKEIFIKYFSSSSPVYDPVMQAKGLISQAERSKSIKESILDIIDKIAQAKLKAGIEEIYRINVDKNSFLIQGIAKSLKDVEKFKNELSKDFKVTVEESVVNAQGKIRFKIKGEK